MFKHRDKNGHSAVHPGKFMKFFVSQLIFNLLRLSFILSSMFSLCVKVSVVAVAAKEKAARRSYE